MEKNKKKMQTSTKLTALYRQEAALEQQLIQVRREIHHLENEQDDFDQRQERNMKRLNEIEASITALLKGKEQ